MPRCLPPNPDWDPDNPGDRHEQRVWEALRDTLPDDAVLLPKLTLLDGGAERELDLVVIWPDRGIAVIEVKGGRVECVDRQWTQTGKPMRDPVEQASTARHALLRYLTKATGVRGHRSVHMVAFPRTSVATGWRQAGCPRGIVIDRDQVATAGDAVRDALDHEAAGRSPLSGSPLEEALSALVGQLGGGAPVTEQLSLLSEAEEHEQRVDLLTREQFKTLDLLGAFPRLQVTGGAGSGKTWLAMEQARRLARQGKSVALLCYSRGLARFFERETETWDAAERPAYVGLFHQLAVEWGAAEGSDDDSDYYERRLPLELQTLAAGRALEDRFDAAVIDEAQDFSDLWWPSVLACLRDPAQGLFVFLDEAQRVFARQGTVPIDLPPVALAENVRNTRRIAQTFGSLGQQQQKYRGEHGPKVRFVACDPEAAVSGADDVVDELIDAGWDPGRIALLTTGRRHPEHVARVEHRTWRGYWDGFLEADDVFYGHVLGFKGLERSVVVLAVNGFREEARAKEMLYVGLSRARTQLVVCGSLDEIARVGGEGVRKRLAGR